MSRFEDIGLRVGQLVSSKNRAYGDSFARGKDFLALLFPSGIRPDQYGTVLCLIRMFDKMMRLANNPGAFDENPFEDLTGYGILGVALMEDASARNDSGAGEGPASQNPPVYHEQQEFCFRR